MRGFVRNHLPVIAPYVVLVILFMTASLMYPRFFSARVIGDLFSDNAFLGIAAAGMTLVILSGGIDLSVGSMLAFTTIFIATLVERGLPPQRGQGSDRSVAQRSGRKRHRSVCA